MDSQQSIHLGDTVRDTITGFEGVVIADTTWLNGCRRLMLQPPTLHDGKPIEAVSFDVEQLVLVKAKDAPAAKPHGGPHPEPTRPEVRR